MANIMYSLLMAITFAGMVLANVEKTIFIAPESIPIPAHQPSLDDLGLERLSPALPSIRTHMNVSFPSEFAPEGVESWILLEDLNPGQRYEVRVCWLATVGSLSSPVESTPPFSLCSMRHLSSVICKVKLAYGIRLATNRLLPIDIHITRNLRQPPLNIITECILLRPSCPPSTSVWGVHLNPPSI